MEELKSKEFIYIGGQLSGGEGEITIQLIVSYKARLELSVYCELTHLSFFA